MKRILAILFFSLSLSAIPLLAYATIEGDGQGDENCFQHQAEVGAEVGIETFREDCDDHETPPPAPTPVPTPPPSPPVSENPNCEVNGLFGKYYNLSSTHPDVEGPNSGLVTGTSPLAKDWFSDPYFVFSRNDAIATFNVTNGYFPVNTGLDGDPYHFAVHWTGSVKVPTDGTYFMELGSDDDSWVFIDGEEVINLGGTHPLTVMSKDIDLSEGEHAIEIYFAERHKVESAIIFKMNGVTFSPCPPEDNTVEENGLPVWTGITSASTTLGALLSFSATATDPDGDNLTYSLELPEGATWNEGTGIFSWTPSATSTLGLPAQAGTTTARFHANDGTGTSTHTVAIEVFSAPSIPTPVNHPPVFVDFNPGKNATSTVNYEYDANATDEDNDVLTYCLSVSPTGMSISGTTGLISWTPTTEQASTTPYNVTACVTDGKSTTTASYEITVAINTTTPTPTPVPTPPPSGGGGGSTTPTSPSTSSGSSSGGGGGGGGGPLGLFGTTNVPPTTATPTTPTTPVQIPGNINAPKSDAAPLKPIGGNTLTKPIFTPPQASPIGGQGGSAPETGNYFGLGALSLLGLLNFWTWLMSNCCLFAWLLWLITLIAFLTYVYFQKKREREMMSEEMISEEEIVPESELEWLDEMKAKEEDNNLL